MKLPRLFFRVILGISLIGWTQFGFALDYSWTISAYTPTYGTPTTSGSPVTACTEHISKIFPSNTFDKIVSLTTTSIACYMFSSGTSSQLGTLTRAGDGCTAPSVYNSATFECLAPEPDQCEPTIGQSINHEHQIYTVAGEPKVDPPGAICENSCQFAFSGTAASDCYRFVDGSKTGGFCKYRYQGNGVSCTADNPQPGSVFDQPPTKPPIDRDPKLEKDQTCDTWVVQPDGTTKRECVSSEAYVEPGMLNCENSNGLVGCTAGKPAPALAEKTVTQVIEQKTNPDGSVTTTTTTTTATTACHGAKDCVEDSSVQTDKSTADAEGNPTTEESDCVGTLCGSATDPTLDPTVDPEEEVEADRTAAVGSCEAAFQCSGDAIDCAILQEQKKAVCQVEDLNDFEKYRDQIDTALTSDEYQIEEEIIEAPSFVQSGARFLPSSCPPPGTAQLSSGSITMSYQPMCDFASGLSPIIVACALLFGAVYVGRAFGA